MALLTSYYSLIEQSKRIDPNGEQARIVEVLNREMGEILRDAPWLPSNDIWVNKTTRRGTLPTGQRRKINERITNSVSRTTEVLDVLGMIADYCEVDKTLVESMPSEAVFLSGEVDAFIEGIGQTMVSDLLYSDSDKDPDAIHGLAPRMSTVDDRFVFNNGGSGDDGTSIYVVTWDPSMAYLMSPKNKPNNGILHEDKGYVTSETSDGKMEIHRDYFEVIFGLCVRHPRAIGRVANIEINGTDYLFDEDNLIKLLNNMKTGPGTRIYMNEVIMSQGQIKLKDKGNVNWMAGSPTALSGEPFLYFSGIPVRKIDREILLNTEKTIS